MERLLQKEVDRIAKIKNYKENYGVKFKVSLLLNSISDRNLDSHKVIITAYGNSISRSRVIFPKDNASDYIPLSEEMNYLLNTIL